jgi:hypothetical protein
MAFKNAACGILRLFGIHFFDCEHCGLASECEGQLMRERLQELCRETMPAPANPRLHLRTTPRKSGDSFAFACNAVCNF